MTQDVVVVDEKGEVTVVEGGVGIVDGGVCETEEGADVAVEEAVVAVEGVAFPPPRDLNYEIL